MHDARDAEDRRLLEAGEHKLLLAAYFHPVRERCFLRLRDRAAGDEAAQRVLLRLLEELRRGKVYRVPYRVVVWMVCEWTLGGFWPGAKHEGTLPEEWDATASDAFAEWEDDHDLGVLLAGLPPRQREVLDLRYREGLGPEQIAERLGITRNAVDQALHNGHRKLREALGA
ncbi:MAG: sigma-70 family RNA polymerase sigma factor [Actinobacteria bacterium]|nr:sigma-70 family RNA polymerase sigma factor [Actinomycetota bacterium]